MSAPMLERRDFLRVSAALGGGLLVGFHLPDEALASAPPPADFAPNAFVRIALDGKVTVIINKAEMGQGPTTSLAMLLAEELDADWTKVGFEFAPVDPVYAHPGYGIQMTGGSTCTLGMSERCARPARPRVRTSSPRLPSGGACRVRSAARRADACCTIRAAGARAMANSRKQPARSRSRATSRSRTRRTSASSASPHTGSTRPTR